MRLRWLHAAATLLWISLIGSTAGCGSGGIKTLSGTITVGGKPLESGSVIVKSEGTGEYVGTVVNGAYTIEGDLRGVLKIAIIPGTTGGSADDPRSAAALDIKKRRGTLGSSGSQPPEQPTPVAEFPVEYQDLGTTPVTHDVSEGPTKDIVIP